MDKKNVFFYQKYDFSNVKKFSIKNKKIMLRLFLCGCVKK